MYLNLGSSVLIRKKDVVGIFDLDTSTIGETTKEFLRCGEKNGKSISVGDDIPKAFVVTADGKIYITTISAASIKGRNDIPVFGMKI